MVWKRAHMRSFMRFKQRVQRHLVTKLQLKRLCCDLHSVAFIPRQRVWRKYNKFCASGCFFFFAFLLLSLLLGSRVNPCMFSKKLFDFSSFHIYSCFFNCYLFYFILSIGLEFSFNLILIWFFSPFRHGSHSFDFDFLIIFLIKLSFNCIPQYFISFF